MVRTRFLPLVDKIGRKHLDYREPIARGKDCYESGIFKGLVLPRPTQQPGPVGKIDFIEKKPSRKADLASVSTSCPRSLHPYLNIAVS